MQTLDVTTSSHAVRLRIAVGVSVAAVTLMLVLTQSRTAVVLLLTDGLSAAALVATLTLAGTWMVPIFIGSASASLPLRWRLLLGAGFGLGATSTLVLVLGVFGLLHRVVWMVLLGGVLVAALAAVLRLRPTDGNPWASRGREIVFGRDLWLLLLVTPFLTMALLVSLVPPGFLWQEEGAGYDVLEYHLQLPKEYFEQGRIAYTPHNVYGSFPANVEMLYLLSMILRGDPYDGAATAKCVNMMLAVLTAFAAYVAGRERSHRAGIVTCVVIATAGWLTYLCGVAYVENGMLLFAMIAAAALLRAMAQTEKDAGVPGSEPAGGTPASAPATRAWIRTAGLMVGLSCGCKYSAVLLVGLPLFVVVGLMRFPSLGARVRACSIFALFGLLGFAPWLIKNTVMTGNPVFPLAHSVFDAYPSGWGETEARHFAESHTPDPEESALTDRLSLLWSRIPGDPIQRFGPLVFLLAGFRLISGRCNRTDVLLFIALVVQVLGWMLGTHLYARFAVPMLVPLALLAGRASDSIVTPRSRRVFLSLIIVGALFNAFMTGKLYVQHLYADGRKLPLEGGDRFFLDGLGGGHEHLATVNHALPPNARILVIGDAKAFYF
ncbi:MAG: hypothetical protein IID43_06785, partial [Planctomycetes bacterium]|nr:hypothetical protein [Planctomycetota bacterium]